VFLLCGRNNPASTIEYDETRARGSLVERSNVTPHGSLFRTAWRT
jgi:hypothetical protein